MRRKKMPKRRRYNLEVKRDLSYFKPARFKDYLTLAELAEFIPCDPSWIKQLERDGRIPKAARVKRGKLSIRLWSPEQANEIRQIISTHKVGRPPNDV